ncbi:MAG: chromate resistance protein ChrB [Nocardioidaceae bacterium]|nr:chromate resistance protein ChrB [Nocardioidaceae bacterium]
MPDWLVLVIRVPGDPARHRVAIWRELRRAGAVVLGAGVWVLPDLPAVLPALSRVDELVERAEGELLRIRATGYDAPDAATLNRMYGDARRDEWTEFLAECDKYLAELDKEHAKSKYTLAELEEEDQSLERLRRWYRDIRGRDLLDPRGPEEADTKLKECMASFDSYADAVYRTLGSPTNQ